MFGILLLKARCAMRIRSTLGTRAACAIAAVVTLVLGASGVAQAASYETDYAITGSSAQCTYDTQYPGGLGSVCFQKYGDVWMVTRSVLETGNTSVQWANQLLNASGSWATYREGQCINALGHSTFGVCNKDYYENSSRNALGGYGSRLRFRACSTTCSAWTPWFTNNQ
ncbi:hypothetical protein [Polymorphospora rubra]|uniref:Secreted protein n=1 Tax=Polymorphospora rubra TaxID=338584 RepID=A0A810N8X7_9ACTN|nr:hypothetical protein [Polymorphospora rubra]BCJ70301.1 hypothetical protein Prubr_73220 [Polymorphospora rubra]